jgi:hypothetical protein
MAGVLVADNGSWHRGQASIDRMAKAWPTAKLVHLPAHLRIVAQPEIYFSIIQLKVLAPNDFSDLETVAGRIIAFQDYWHTTCTLFDWKLTPEFESWVGFRGSVKADLAVSGRLEAF